MVSPDMPFENDNLIVPQNYPGGCVKDNHCFRQKSDWACRNAICQKDEKDQKNLSVEEIEQSTLLPVEPCIKCGRIYVADKICKVRLLFTTAV